MAQLVLCENRIFIRLIGSWWRWACNQSTWVLKLVLSNLDASLESRLRKCTHVVANIVNRGKWSAVCIRVRVQLPFSYASNRFHSVLATFFPWIHFEGERKLTLQFTAFQACSEIVHASPLASNQLDFWRPSCKLYRGTLRISVEFANIQRYAWDWLWFHCAA